MGDFNSKYQEDENCLRIIEIKVEIFSYFDNTEKMKIFFHGQQTMRWFDIANKEIEALSIKWPQEKSQFNF